MPKAVIFDVDGTLIDSKDLHTECCLGTVEHFGLDFAYDQVRGESTEAAINSRLRCYPPIC